MRHDKNSGILVSAILVLVACAPVERPTPLPVRPTSPPTPAALTLAEPPPPEETPSVLTESAAVAWAVRHSPAIHRSQAAFERALGERDEALAERRPAVTIDSEIGRADRLGSSTEANANTSAGVGLFLRHRFFDGKSRWFTHLSARRRSEAASFEREAAKNRVAAEARLGFAKMRHWYRVTQAQEAEASSLNDILSKLRLLTAYGLNTMEPVHRLSAQRQNLLSTLEDSRAKMAEAHRETLKLIGAPPKTRLSVLSIAPNPSTLPGTSELTVAALQRRPEMQAAQLTIQAQRAALEAVRRERYPSADAVLGVASEGDVRESARDPWRTDGRVGLRASWNALDFGRNKAKQRQELATLHEMENDFEQLQRDIRIDIAGAIERLQFAASHIGAARLERQEAQASLALALEAFHADVGDIETVIRAHRAVRASRFSESEARFRQEESQVLLDFARGVAAERQLY